MKRHNYFVRKFGNITAVFQCREDIAVFAPGTWPDNHKGNAWRCIIYAVAPRRMAKGPRKLSCRYGTSPRAALRRAVRNAREELIDLAYLYDQLPIAESMLERMLAKVLAKEATSTDREWPTMRSYLNAELKFCRDRMNNVIQLRKTNAG